MKRIVSALALLCLLSVAPFGRLHAQTAQPVPQCNVMAYQANGLPMPLTQTPGGALCTIGNAPGATYGPTPVGSAVANPPLMVGYQSSGGNVVIVTPSLGLPEITEPGSTTTATSTVSSPTNTPTISTSAYVTGYVLGGIQSFAGQPNTGILTNANVSFNSGTFSGSVDLYVFNASPTGGGTTDHAAFALTATDTGKLIGVLHSADCTSLGSVLAQCQVLYQSQVYTLAASGTTIYVVAVVRGTPTFAGASDAAFSLNVIK